jgi:hypothetical protein
MNAIVEYFTFSRVTPATGQNQCLRGGKLPTALRVEYPIIDILTRLTMVSPTIQ